LLNLGVYTAKRLNEKGWTVLQKSIETCVKQLESELDQMLQQVISWANINSGSYNIAGLDRYATELEQAFAGLNAEFSQIELPSEQQIDLHGKTDSKPLGKLLRWQQRPQAKTQILLMGHMDTVYPPSPVPQLCRYEEGIVYGPGVTDM